MFRSEVIYAIGSDRKMHIKSPVGVPPGSDIEKQITKMQYEQLKFFPK
jgi:hypothetical protein